MQRALEDISFKLRIPQRKPWQAMAEDIVKATKIMNNEQKVDLYLWPPRLLAFPSLPFHRHTESMPDEEKEIPNPNPFSHLPSSSLITSRREHCGLHVGP